jgi:uncharacterized protein (TIGR00369 family)
MTSATNRPRTGPFWDAAEGRAPLPPAAATLGFELVGADPEQGTLEVAFTAGHPFTTPLGHVLGGFLAAMLYDTVGPTVLSTLGDGQFIKTLDMSTYFLEAARPGRLIGRGRILKRTDDIVIVEASLVDEKATVATAVASILVVPIDIHGAARDRSSTEVVLEHDRAVVETTRRVESEVDTHVVREG